MPKFLVKSIVLGELLVDPDNMDRAMRAIVDGFRSKTPKAPINVTEYKGGKFLIDGHHRIAAMVFETEDYDELLEKEVEACVTSIKSLKDWPYEDVEEFGPDNWTSLHEWIIDQG